MGVEIPEKIRNAPELRVELEFYMRVWSELSSDRPVFMDGSVGNIPWKTVIEYAEYHSFDRELTDDLVFYIRKLDEVYVRHIREKVRQSMKNTTPKK